MKSDSINSLSGKVKSAWKVAAYGTVRLLIVAIVKLLWNPEIKGAENIPKKGAYLLAPSHRSFIDFALVALLTRRRLRYMGKDSLWKYKPAGFVLSTFGAFPVKRGTPDRKAFNSSIDVLNNGEVLVMFPEGTRKTGWKIGELFDGTIYIAMKAKIPIIPVGIGGSENALPKGKWLPRRQKVVIVVGKPMWFSDEQSSLQSSSTIPRSVLKQKSEQLQNKLQELFDRACQNSKFV
ncbi:MAG: 1-acyl-sn-glycerol-3-phosphate acyltransferase [Actinobacteria bacterium]|nr:1-acyl-sn-glycerol-3-phosphate acyltransferase [Actinomycetota bacterium]MCL6104098.1 1-acyl-sn-glycerol-3-phosphate acyltransferase [Actinomycetota bacterium]